MHRVFISFFLTETIDHSKQILISLLYFDQKLTTSYLEIMSVIVLRTSLRLKIRIIF